MFILKTGKKQIRGIQQLAKVIYATLVRFQVEKGIRKHAQSSSLKNIHQTSLVYSA